MPLYQRLLEFAGIERERFHVEWVSASEGPRYSKVTKEFSEKIEELGNSPLRDEIFL